MARVVAVEVPHHVTQRGNARQFILACDPPSMKIHPFLCHPERTRISYLTALACDHICGSP
jgi:hypothetical protein